MTREPSERDQAPHTLGGVATARALAPIVVIATLALLLLGGASRTRLVICGSVVGRLQHAARPLEHQFQHAIQKAIRP